MARKSTQKTPYYKVRLQRAKKMNVCPTCSRHRETGEITSLADPEREKKGSVADLGPAPEAAEPQPKPSRQRSKKSA